MLQLDVIGSISLRRRDGKEVGQLLRQPKRLALLAYLAMPTPGTWHRRDTLLGVFWPELDTPHARTALRNALYVLRQALGDGVVLTRGDEEVSIDPAMLTTDVAALWSAIREDRANEAISLYHGEVLPGLYPADSEGFHPWLEAQRAKLRAEVARVATRHADMLEADGRAAEALGMARRVLEIQGDDETAVRRLLRLHERTGDRAGGLAEYERFAARLREEFGADPDAQTLALAERLRQSKGSPTPPVPQTPVSVSQRESVGDSRKPAPWRSARPMAMGAVLVLATGVGGYLMSRDQESPTIGRSYPVTTDEGLQIQPALSPNGELVAYAKGTPGRLSIWLQRLDGGTAWRLSRDSSATELVPRWSPGNDQILYLASNHAWVSAAFGGTPRVVVSGLDDDRSVRSASWSPGGDSVAFVRNDSLQVKSLDGPGVRLVGTGEQLHSCAWSPDGRWIACVSGNWIAFVRGPLFQNRAPSGIVLFPAAGGPAIAFTDMEHEYQCPTWTADSRALWVLSDRDGLSGEVLSIPVRRDGKPGRPTHVGLNAQWISREKDRVAYSDYIRAANVWSIPIPQRDLEDPPSVDGATPITSGNRIIEIVSVSKDRRWLVYDSNERGDSDVYRLALDAPQQVPERLTEDPREEFIGGLSPDGRYLAYHLFVGGKRRLRVKRLADGVIEEPLPAPGDQGGPRWSPDGNAIAAWAHESESGEIFVVRRTPDGAWSGPSWRLRDAQLPVWSPDGRTLAFVTLAGNIELIAADSGERRILYAPRPGTDDPRATNVVWESGRTHLWFIGNLPSGEGGIWAVPLDGGRPHRVLRLTSENATSYGPVFDSDGANFYFVLEERLANVRYAELVNR